MKEKNVLATCSYPQGVSQLQSLNSSSNFKHRTLKGYLGVGVTAAGLDKLQEAVPGQVGGGGSVPVAGDSLQAVRSVPPQSADPSVRENQNDIK